MLKKAVQMCWHSLYAQGCAAQQTCPPQACCALPKPGHSAVQIAPRTANNNGALYFNVAAYGSTMGGMLDNADKKDWGFHNDQVGLASGQALRPAAPGRLGCH
jgi:hypothetical protein